jgi:hypothetical protein
MRLNLIVAATVVAVTGCSEDLKPHLAACKAEATEAHVSAQDLATYLRECMRAQGWPIKDACLDTPQMWDSPKCYLR